MSKPRIRGMRHISRDPVTISDASDESWIPERWVSDSGPTKPTLRLDRSYGEAYSLKTET